MRDPGQNLDNVKAKDGRIIIGYFDLNNAITLMCKVGSTKEWHPTYIIPSSLFSCACTRSRNLASCIGLKRKPIPSEGQHEIKAG